ncbi:hypothetical protein [Klebsiella pneumoniae]|uniref:hypothetical protein n=1 Tax=Klebsiella pneumoniae TaxID=573 RepID=UPI000E2BDF58|nr:hypothetical protein [Klebsiella pneumoniae]SXQ32486.1 Uncharacterised protein [Klebsiella pneumoniae]
MTTDITELAQREKFEAWFKSSFHPDKTGPYIKDQLYFSWKAASAELVEALEKAQQSVELVDLQRDKIKRLESDLWDKEQLRKVHSEKSFELEGKVRELEARNQKDFVWRGEEIGRLNDEVDELKEKLESRTVKMPSWFVKDAIAVYDRDEIEEALSAAGIKVEAE